MSEGQTAFLSAGAEELDPFQQPAGGIELGHGKKPLLPAVDSDLPGVRLAFELFCRELHTVAEHDRLLGAEVDPRQPAEGAPGGEQLVLYLSGGGPFGQLFQR